ncbi:MAG: fructosamine kinase family protein [Bacteroidetes bacterium]|nr:fructosamine kinase family protein [Bacteroidota bacterium]MBU1578084.1 fructosamine kinase family protein [Bacteroidota bacterium]MBU2466118.1 fructosamine kinase family protein [Bacteroidota bacterium]MBU2557097.1 fructosamine kinase family protein [Bacteroidota bacterium]
MIPFSIVPEIEKLLQSHTGKEGLIDETSAVGGGSINSAYRLVYAGQSFFLKYNHAGRFPKMFEQEAAGLTLLRQSRSLHIPSVIGTGSKDQISFILLDYITEGQTNKVFWEKFGVGLAAMHKNTNTHFGLDHSNYIGSLRQENTHESSWSDFFIRHRLQPQLSLALKKGLISSKINRDFEKLFPLLPKLFPQETPALLHGDLWSGNFLCSSEGAAVLIDPAVYYGHREMDLGMSKLFGGFHPHFYAAYHEAWPLEKGWQERVDLCNLYPLLVHVNLFGSSYTSQVQSCLQRFV